MDQWSIPENRWTTYTRRWRTVIAVGYYIPSWSPIPKRESRSLTTHRVETSITSRYMWRWSIVTSRCWKTWALSSGTGKPTKLSRGPNLHRFNQYWKRFVSITSTIPLLPEHRARYAPSLRLYSHCQYRSRLHSIPTRVVPQLPSSGSSAPTAPHPGKLQSDLPSTPRSEWVLDAPNMG